jgi:hypothetical protein
MKVFEVREGSHYVPLSFFVISFPFVTIGRGCVCGTAAANGFFVQLSSDDTWVNLDQMWTDTTWYKPKDSGGKACPSATLFTKSPTWTFLVAKPGLRDEKPATNRS